MSLSREELLRPSLGDRPITRAPYSVRTAFITSFFGGPFAAIGIIGANSVRLQRWRQDLLPLGLLFAATAGFFASLHLTAWGEDLGNYLFTLAGQRGVPYLSRVIALAIFGIGYALHRKEQRSADFMGLDRPNGWIGGIACIVGGMAAAFLFSLLIAAVKGQ
jgi:hypothetical protein